MTPAEERQLVLGALELIRQFLNQSSLKLTDETFYYHVKDFCADTINAPPSGWKQTAGFPRQEKRRP